MSEALQRILAACLPVICLLITAGGAYAVALIRKQTDQLKQQSDNELLNKYIEMASEAVVQAVTCTAQTFVDSLKAEGKFDKEKQLEAFQKAKQMVLDILGDTTVKALYELYGDFNTWLNTKIEQVCRDLKTTEVDGAAATAATVASAIATTTMQQLAAEVMPGIATTAEEKIADNNI